MHIPPPSFDHPYVFESVTGELDDRAVTCFAFAPVFCALNPGGVYR